MSKSVSKMLKCVKMTDGSYGFEIHNVHFPIKEAIKCAQNTCGLEEKIIPGCEKCCPVLSSTGSPLKHLTKAWSMQETNKGCLNENSNWKNMLLIIFGMIILVLVIERFRKDLTKMVKRCLKKLHRSSPSDPSSSSNSGTNQDQEGQEAMPLQSTSHKGSSGRLRFPEGDWNDGTGDECRHIDFDEDGDEISSRIVPVVQQTSPRQRHEEKPLHYTVAPTAAPSWEP